MRFAVGTEVFVVSLGKKGRVVAVGGRGRYRVIVGAVSTWCEEGDLATVSAEAKKAKRAKPVPHDDRSNWTSDAHVPTGAEKRALGTLDLHGMTVEEALAAVEVRLDRAIRAGLDRVEIIHGISGGRLRAAVRRFLAGVASVRFSPDPKNPGVTVVYL